MTLTSQINTDDYKIKKAPDNKIISFNLVLENYRTIAFIHIHLAKYQNY